MGFWLALGVSGFRVDAAPFVIAHRGPDAEKQPHESFDYLEEFSEFLRWKTGDAILVAEANVAPDQILNYFGERGQRMTMVIRFSIAGVSVQLASVTAEKGSFSRLEF